MKEYSITEGMQCPHCARGAEGVVMGDNETVVYPCCSAVYRIEWTGEGTFVLRALWTP